MDIQGVLLAQILWRAMRAWAGWSPAVVRSKSVPRGPVRSGCLLVGEDIMTDRTSHSLRAQAAAFARMLSASDDTEIAFRQASALAEGLFPHQVEGVAFLLGRTRAILADDMGLGKTRQAIAALGHAVPEGQRLVVCPASVKRNWAREIALAIANDTVHIIEGTRAQRVP